MFPSGAACHNFDDLVVHCLASWEEAVELLQGGALQSFFRRLDRMDLVDAAREAANFPDRDRGLDLLLSRLPVPGLPPAKMEVQPRLITLGPLRVGDSSAFEVVLHNRGRRLIHGSIAADCPWLAVADVGDARHFQFRTSLALSIQVRGQHLRAGKPLEGTLVLDTNAGVFKLKVIAEVPIVPYPDDVLGGARTPREIAEKAKTSSRQAAKLFESGAVARWYHANGWTYPVQGPRATGVAALQQFFEALGLSKPPRVHVSEAHLAVTGRQGEQVARQIVVQAEENRAVYVHAVSPAPWLRVGAIAMQGRTALVPLDITIPDRTAVAALRLVANGNQQFDISVQASVVAPPPATIAPPETRPMPARASNGMLLHLLPMLVLGVLLIGVIGRDTFRADRPGQVAVQEEQEERSRHPVVPTFQVAVHDEPDDGLPTLPAVRYQITDEPEERSLKAPPPPVQVEIRDEPAETAPAAQEAPIDPVLRLSYQPRGLTWGMTDTSSGKLLTYAADGSTNRTILRVNGRAASGIGQFRSLPDEPARQARKRSSYTVFPQPGLKVTQFLEIVPSKQPVDVGGQPRRRMDTLLVRYLLENTGTKAVTAGIRLEVDTLIGGNDGVPFTVPGRGLVNISADFTHPEEVPDFVQALETGKLRSPGTVVHVSLKVGGGVEPPARVTLCHWNSNGDLANIRATNMGADSAIILVWPDQSLAVGGRREVGYAYGLGSVSVADPGGSLGVTLGGSFDIGKSFTITAYVNKPAAGQTLTLDLPAGLERLKGEPTQRVAPPTVGDTSIVSWEARVQQTGVFPVKVRSSTGVTQTKTVSIAQGAAPTGGKLTLEVDGSFEPGQAFRVLGRVQEPLPNQTLTLELPAGLSRIAGDAAQRMPTPVAGSKDALVEWRVRVDRAGKYPVRVVSSTGVVQTKTLTIVQPGRAEGAYQVFLAGDFAPGKVFTVSTRVINPAPDQKLTLVLPAGLEHVDGAQTQLAKPEAPLTWKVRITEVGKYTVGVRSTTGVTQRKTLVIEPPRDQAGQFSFQFIGAIEPGKDFRVVADVPQPSPDQTLKLVLPAGLELADGPPVQPAASTVTWAVRAKAPGRLPVRIESSTGLARTRTIMLTETGKSLFGR